MGCNLNGFCAGCGTVGCAYELKATISSFQSICALTAAALGEFEFRDDESADRALTERLIENLTEAAGGPDRVKAARDGVRSIRSQYGGG